MIELDRYRRLQELFHRAVELPETERTAFADRECAGDLSLRRDLQDLLARDQEAANGILGEDLVPPAVAAEPIEAKTAPLHSSDGERIDRYRLLRVIGEGGMGTVWEAQQAEPVQRRVALKLIKPGMDSARVIARFEFERQTLSLMSHPNIARVLDGGSTQLGRPYFVMEYWPGSPITNYCDDHRLGLRARLHLFLVVLDAVQHAHQRGVLHRDLKPTNILVADRDGVPEPKIIDFGIARALDGERDLPRLHTRVDEILGTFEYCSPEHLAHGLCDSRSDVYSLGVVLYELLTGTRPFTTRRDAATAICAQLHSRTLDRHLLRPSERLATALSSTTSGADPRNRRAWMLAIRGDLDAITTKALAHEADHRYPTAAEFAGDLRRHLCGEVV